MDLQQLTNLFATTYSSDPNVQKSGELQIRKVRCEWSSLCLNTFSLTVLLVVCRSVLRRA